MSFFTGYLCHQILPRIGLSAKRGKFDDINLLRNRTKSPSLCFFIGKYFFHIKAKLMVSKSVKSQSVVGFLINCILEYAQRHLLDFCKKRSANFNFIWLEWNSYNSSIQFHIVVWSRSSFFKLQCSVDQGWYHVLQNSFGNMFKIAKSFN